MIVAGFDYVFIVVSCLVNNEVVDNIFDSVIVY